MANRDEPFARGLRAARAAADLSQEELAQLIDVSRDSVANWEKGDFMPSMRTALRVADVLGVSLDQLAGRA
jgi:putative transcriptional regulator